MTHHHPLLQPERRFKERSEPMRKVEDYELYRDMLALASRLGLPVSIAREAYRLFRRARWKPRGLKAAAVLETARARRIMLSVEEVARAAGVEPGTVYTGLQALGVKHRWLKPEHYLPSIASKLCMSGELSLYQRPLTY